MEEVTLPSMEGYYLMSCYPLIDNEGNRWGAVSVVRDITELKRAHNQLLHTEKLAALGRLTAGTTHEILNPLNVISMLLQMRIKDLTTPAEITSDLKVAKEQADRIYKIILNLLHFSRQKPPVRQPVDLSLLINRCLALVEHDLRMQEIEVDMEVGTDLQPVPCDEDQLYQVILNLINNACDEMPKRGRLILRASNVLRDNQKFVEVMVEDTGGGIPPELLDKIFEPFFSTKPEGKGTGLGLSFCQGVIVSHGGSIWAENAPGGGTSIIFSLPLQDSQ